MNEFLWVILGVGLGLIGGFLWPRTAPRAARRTPLQKSEIEELRGQLGKATTALEEARLDLARAHKRADGLDAEIATLKTRLPKLEGFERANADLRVQLQGFDAVKARLDAATAELAAAKPQLAAAADVNARLEATQAELTALKNRTAGFEGVQARAAQVDALEARIAQLEGERVQLLGDANAAALRASDAERAQEKVRAALNESLGEVARTRAGMQRFSALEAQIKDLEARGISPEAQGRIDGLERDLQAARLEGAGLKDQLHERNAALTATRDRLASAESLAARVATLEAALASREAELERLRTATT
jgi:DNA repair exonuclease SbcCD ATPase subunit